MYQMATLDCHANPQFVNHLAANATALLLRRNCYQTSLVAKTAPSPNAYTISKNHSCYNIKLSVYFWHYYKIQIHLGRKD